MKHDDLGHEERIKRTAAQLRACRGDYRPIHEELDRRRQAWWEANRDTLRLSGPLPRQAYTMFLVCHLGLDPAEAPVVYEDEQRIVWRSFNFCSMLEACIRLGLDTRQVCRAGAEESVQNLIARLDPRLRFSRDYGNGIRPYAPYCEEQIQIVEESQVKADAQEPDHARLAADGYRFYAGEANDFAEASAPAVAEALSAGPGTG
jgi:hypothetical protein